jgi:hypothetical protein
MFKMDLYIYGCELGYTKINYPHTSCSQIGADSNLLKISYSQIHAHTT